MPVKQSKPPTSGARDAVLPFFLKREHNRLAFLFGRQTALRLSSDVIDQLQQQIELLQYTATEQKHQVDALSRELLKGRRELVELGEARLELARRDLRDALASADSPSAMVH